MHAAAIGREYKLLDDYFRWVFSVKLTCTLQIFLDSLLYGTPTANIVSRSIEEPLVKRVISLLAAFLKSFMKAEICPKRNMLTCVIILAIISLDHVSLDCRKSKFIWLEIINSARTNIFLGGFKGEYLVI